MIKNNHLWFIPWFHITFIPDISTVSVPDTVAVIESLLQLIPRHITEDQIVRMGDFGSFGLRIGSVGAESENDFN